jgi:nucleotidyltransferase/DNA polymerase involved in DNA repair
VGSGVATYPCPSLLERLQLRSLVLKPIEELKNLGPKTGAELRQIGIETADDLVSLGYRKAFLKWVSIFPERVHLMAWYALVGAELNISYSKISEDHREEGRKLLFEIRRRRKKKK